MMANLGMAKKNNYLLVSVQREIMYGDFYNILVARNKKVTIWHQDLPAMLQKSKIFNFLQD